MAVILPLTIDKGQSTSDYLTPMRIISGTYGGRTLKVPKGLPARPTTDRAKEALFNILMHELDWEETDVLDLFTGTGNIALECISRGARSVTAVEKDGRSVSALKETIAAWQVPGLSVLKMDVKSFVNTPRGPFGLIFLDPPYKWDGVEELISQLLAGEWLTADGLLVAEHVHTRSLEQVKGWEETRKYGDSCFSFFRGNGSEPENSEKT